MQSKATLRYLRIAPRKVRLVANLIKGKKVSEAQTLLQFVSNSAVESFQKLIQSALASASHNFQIDQSNVYIAKITVNEGPKLKRFRPRARGRAYPIQKKTSHITIVLEEAGMTRGDAQRESGESSKAGPSQFRQLADLAGKPKFGREEKSRRPKLEGVRNRIFRRKAV